MSISRDKMEREKTTSRAPWLLLVGGWIVLFSLSCRLALRPADAATAIGAGGGVAAVLIGQGRQAMSSGFYSSADRFFHRGVAHVAPRAFDDGFFIRLNKQLLPDKHLHREGMEVIEIMPWLWLALRADPENVEAWRVAAFWLGSQLKRYDLAHRLLLDAQQNNPFCYPIKLDLARLHIRQNRTEEAEREIDAALAFLLRHELPDDETVRFDLAEILLYKALLCESDNRLDEAAAHIDGILALFPERDQLRLRQITLRAGRTPEPSAAKLLETLLRQQEEALICNDPDHDHDHDHDHAEDAAHPH